MVQVITCAVKKNSTVQVRGMEIAGKKGAASLCRVITEKGTCEPQRTRQ